MLPSDKCRNKKAACQGSFFIGYQVSSRAGLHLLILQEGRQRIHALPGHGADNEDGIGAGQL